MHQGEHEGPGEGIDIDRTVELEDVVGNVEFLVDHPDQTDSLGGGAEDGVLEVGVLFRDVVFLLKDDVDGLVGVPAGRL